MQLTTVNAELTEENRVDQASETEIRHRASHLALAWHEEKAGEFRGASVQDFADMIVAAHVAADESRLSLHRWVDAGRRAGMSWAEIGALIGVTKQAAQQRFRGSDDEPVLPGENGEIVTRFGATAFNEVGMLSEEGRKGNELIGTGALQLVFRKTERPWEHRRVVAVSTGTMLENMSQSGWTYVSSWFPFHYFKRPKASG